jgi:hypothetical protein
MRARRSFLRAACVADLAELDRPRLRGTINLIGVRYRSPAPERWTTEYEGLLRGRLGD